MKELPIKNYVIYVFGIVIFIFMLNKLYLRSWILEKELPGIFAIISLLIPNLIEAITLTLILNGIFLQAREHFSKRLGGLKTIHIQLIATALAAIYVIAQELKFHNLGGNNVYDPFDLAASIIGLLGTFVILRFYGFTDKTKKESKD